MATKYRIKNWSKFQHYKDRNPPWIKLHVELLASEDWVTLADASKLLMVVCMVIAARENGLIPGNADYIKRVAYLDKRPDLTPLIQCGFLEEVLADASESKQEQATARPEAEQRREEKKEITAPAVVADPNEAEAVKAYNDLAAELGWPQCIKLNAMRKKHLRARLADCGGIDGWYSALARAKASKFLRGETSRGAGHENWTPNIDFFLTESKFIKLIEGGFDGSTAAPAVTTTPTKALTDDDWRSAIRRFQADHKWPGVGYGPQPGYGGCVVPPKILAEFNLESRAA